MTTVKAYSIAGTGYYKSNTWGFENDANAALPYRWTSAYAGTNSIQTINASQTTHNKIFQLKCGDGGASHWSGIQLTININSTFDVEMWWYQDAVAANCWIGFTDEGTNILGLGAISSLWKMLHGGWDTIGTGTAPLLNTWQHISIRNINFDTNTYDIYIDGATLAGGSTGLPFGNAATKLTNVVIISGTDLKSLYIDGLAFTCYGNYTRGDNINAYDTVVYRNTKARRGTHESHHDFSAFDITKMSFPSQI